MRNSYCNSGENASGDSGTGPSRRIITGGYLQPNHQCREGELS